MSATMKKTGERPFAHRVLAVLTAALTVCVLIFSTFPATSAAGDVVTEDGKYDVPIEKDLAMGGSKFSDSVTVEKEGENYYMTFSVLDSSSVSQLRLLHGEDTVGQLVRYDGAKTHYTYTLTAEDLQGDLTFSMFINAMNTEKSFAIRLNWAGMKKLNGRIDDLGERPAPFIPAIVTAAGDTELEKGTVYPIVPAEARLCGEAIPVTVNAYYLQDGEQVPVRITDNQFKLENIGEYHVIYRAESDLYKTNLGNNTFAERDITILSRVGAVSMAKLEGIGDQAFLPENPNVQAALAGEDSAVYQKVSEYMKGFSDHYEVISVSLYAEDGHPIDKLDGEVALYLKADSRFDRREVQVFRVAEDGTLTEMETNGAGRYVRVNTDQMGDFAICVPGVDFVMPMWGYAAIMLGGLVLLAAVIVIPIVVTVRRRKRMAAED